MFLRRSESDSAISQTRSVLREHDVHLNFMSLLTLDVRAKSVKNTPA
jgi:hypothetical protein